ncbi:MAG: acyl-CoA thioesterase-1 [Arenicella sp.]|jgi:acyl-CoA thioesterase-1
MHNCDPQFYYPTNPSLLKQGPASRAVRLVFAIAVLLAIASCGGGDSNSGGASAQAGMPQATPDQPVIRSFVAIGDSIGNGAGYVSVPWPELVQGAFGVSLVNDSINGRQTGQGLNLIRDLLTRHDPSHVLILLGTNDATKGGSVSGAIANLQEIANIAEGLG